MEILDWILSISTIIVAVLTIIIVMMQNSKTSGNAIVNDSNTFYANNKGKTMDGLLSKLTVIMSIIFIVLCVATTISLMI